MREIQIQTRSGALLVRMREGDAPILLLHGLGESGLSFLEAFDHPALFGRSLIVPDLPGFGKSAAASGPFDSETLVGSVQDALDELKIDAYSLIGHSMGGMLGTLLCAGSGRDRARKFVNVEGNLTRLDAFISQEAAKAAANGRFEAWFSDDFLAKGMLYGQGQRHVAFQRYYFSLCQCNPQAFRDMAVDTVRRNPNATIPGDDPDAIGALYASLTVPHIYCHGDWLKDSASLAALKTQGAQTRYFPGSTHWVMEDRADAFYPFVAEFFRS